jgi:hypothetical protein
MQELGTLRLIARATVSIYYRVDAFYGSDILAQLAMKTKSLLTL